MYTNCHTYYSLRFGTFSEVKLLEMAKACGIETLVLTDINNTSACLNFIRLSENYGIKPVVGIDFRNGALQEFVGIAKNNDGFQELNSYLSKHLHNKSAIPKKAPEFVNSFIIYPFEKVLRLEKTDFLENEFIGISLANLRRLPFSKYKEYTGKLVIQQPVTFRNKRDFNAHRLLRAIDNNIVLSKLQVHEQGSLSEKMIPKKELIAAFENYPHIVENTSRVLEECAISFGFGVKRVSQNQKVFGTSKEEDFTTLQNLCSKRLNNRYKKPTKIVLERLAAELKTINTLNFVSYFLINLEIVTYAKSKGYMHVGRGSGANSIVAYILGITDVDPVALDLYFERFINPYRASPPDFDIDFSWQDREDVTAHIFKRFKNTALLAVYSTFKYRAVVRELGKVFGLPKTEIDRLSTNNYTKDTLSEMGALVLKYGALIEGFPNMVSVHSAGILILEKPIHYYSATSIPPKGFPTVQFDMIIAEDIGLFKFDILGQRGLAKIKDAIAIIKENQPNAKMLDIDNVETFKNDKNINKLLSTGRAIGAYYVESPAMRGLMKKLGVSDYLGLVAASSVIRPGVSSSGMKEEYIRRKRDPKRRKLADPILAEIMPETFGIMVYQEDVLKVAHLFGGLDLGESDILRRGMSGKFRSREEFKRVKVKFFSNCREKGFSDTITTNIWDQISSFAGFAFAKGHSASYAVESYQSLYLKCYFPLEFMTAVLNNGGGFYTSEHYIQEARMCGAIIEAPCINNSDYANAIKGITIYLGFGYLKNLENKVIQRFLSERQLHGMFESLDDFIDRVAIGLEQLSILIRIGAFKYTLKSKNELHWQAIFKLDASKKKSQNPELFKTQHKSFNLPSLEHHWLEDAYDQMELLGFSLYNYFDLLSEELTSNYKAVDMPKFKNKNIVLYGVLVNTRFNTTKQGKNMRLSTFIDADGYYFDAVHFTGIVEKYPINGKGVYYCYGTVTEEFDHYSIKILKTSKMAVKADPRSKPISEVKAIA